MAYDTKTVKRDGSGITPVPQHFNPIADDYEPIYGRNNAGRVELYGPDGNPISIDDSNKLAVRASEIETILNEIKSKDFATQTTAAAILAKLIAAPSTEAKQDALAALIGEVDADPTANSLLARLKSLEDKIDAIIDGSSPAVTQLSGSNLPLVAGTAEIGKVRLVGETLAEQLTETDAVAGVLTFAANISTIEIYNTDAANAGVFMVNGIAINLPASTATPSTYKSLVGGTPSTEVTITGATTYIVSRYV